MRIATLHPGDHVQVDVRGTVFNATVKSVHPGCSLVGIEPDQPERYTWRSVTARRVVKKLEGQERLEVLA